MNSQVEDELQDQVVDKNAKRETNLIVGLIARDRYTKKFFVRFVKYRNNTRKTWEEVLSTTTARKS